jgi:hypothetical protein
LPTVEEMGGGDGAYCYLAQEHYIAYCLIIVFADYFWYALKFISRYLAFQLLWEDKLSIIRILNV